jgi:hypothetical protein
MKHFVFLIRPSVNPLTLTQIEERTQKWRTVISEFRRQGILSNWQVFDDQGVKISGSDKQVTQHFPVVDHEETVGGVITITADGFDQAVELSKLCPVLEYGGSVEVRNVKS